MSGLGPSLASGDVAEALASYNPLTDVWAVATASGTDTVTVTLADEDGAVPYIAPSLASHYTGALVRFTSGKLSGGGHTAGQPQWNTTLASLTSTVSATTVTFGDAWPSGLIPAAGDTFAVIRGAGIGTELALGSGTTVELTPGATVTADLAAGATVALESGTTVSASFASGTTVDLAPGATVTANIGSVNTVDISGQTVAVSSITEQVTVSGAVTILGIDNVVTTTPSADRSAQMTVTTVAAGASADFSLAPNWIWHLSLAAGGDGGGYVRVFISGGAWIAGCGVPGSQTIDWNHSGYKVGDNPLWVYNAGSADAQVSLAIEYS